MDRMVLVVLHARQRRRVRLGNRQFQVLQFRCRVIRISAEGIVFHDAGIGVASLAADRGYDLVLVDRSADALESLRADIGPQTAVETVIADVTDLAALTSGIDATRSRRGALSAVAHSAGIEVVGAVDELDPADWARCINVNLTGTFNTARAVIPELIESRGALALIASDAGVTGAQGYAAYCASKHGVVGLMRAMALDYGPRGVRVNAIAPSFVETPMADRIFEGHESERDFYRATVPIGRFATPTEIADVALHLLSERASYTTGMVYRVDGGATAGYFQPAAD